MQFKDLISSHFGLIFQSLNSFSRDIQQSLLVTIVQSNYCFMGICDALYHLLPKVQFKKHEKHRRRSVTFSKIAFNFTRSNTPSWLFFTFSKLYNWYQIAQGITFSRLQLILLLIIHISSLIITCNQKDFPISKSFSSLCYLWSGLVCDFPSSTLCQFCEAFVIFCNLTRPKIGICCLF